MPDPWVSGGIVLAVLGIILTIYYGRRRKELSYRVLSVKPVLAITGDDLDKRASLTLDGTPLYMGVETSISVVTIRIWNSGTEPISKQDFEGNSYLTFAGLYKSPRVLTPGIDPKTTYTFAGKAYLPYTTDNKSKSGYLSTNAANALDVVALQDTTNPVRLVFPPRLFNKGDSVEVKAIVMNCEKVSLEAVIAGCRAPRERRKILQPSPDLLSSRPVQIAKLAVSLAATITFFVVGIADSTNPNPKAVVIFTPLDVVFFALYILVLIVLVIVTLKFMGDLLS